MAIDPEDTGCLQDDVARRLKYSRIAVGVDQQDFAEAAGISQPRYNPYETGKRLLTLPAAMMLCERYSLSLDWLYRGDPSGLPNRLLSKINDLRRKP
jgi:transcriptional regulator with XRE-family HTH domain